MSESDATIDRRHVLKAGLLAAAMPAVLAAASPDAIGAPSGARERKVAAGGATLWCWDSGGSGTAIVLMHPASGNAAIWERQYRPLTDAGYRLIAYSRRGYFGSDVGPAGDPGNGGDDLHAVADAFGLDRFHLLGCAAGGFIVPDYALRFPGRLSGIVIACSQGGAADPVFRATLDRIMPPGFAILPVSFRELGPSCRAIDPAGVARWEAIERANPPGPRARQRVTNTLDWPTLSRIAVPTLVMAGDADPYMPVALAREYASHLPHSRFVALPECGHSPHWERPALFNRLVLAFLAEHRGRR